MRVCGSLVVFACVLALFGFYNNILLLKKKSTTDWSARFFVQDCFLGFGNNSNLSFLVSFELFLILINLGIPSAKGVDLI